MPASEMIHRSSSMGIAVPNRFRAFGSLITKYAEAPSARMVVDRRNSQVVYRTSDSTRSTPGTGNPSCVSQ
jgi:hypothetical protein